jgi:hypothetical protein
MTPTHTNKSGVRYRYYVSHVILQSRNTQAGSVPRVPAPEVETAVVKAVRERLDAGQNGTDSTALDERVLIDHHVHRVVVKRGSIEVHLTEEARIKEGQNGANAAVKPDNLSPAIIAVPWSTPGSTGKIKGILDSPGQSTSVISTNRDGLLMAIAKARIWINDLLEGRIASFAEIAAREGKVERHIRLLAPLAFVSPRLISEIIDGVAPSDLTVTGLAQALAYSWAKQHQTYGKPRGLAVVSALSPRSQLEPK